MTTNRASERPRTGLAGVLARHALVSYFVIAYAVSWGVWIPYLLSRDGFGLLRFESPISHTLSGYLFSFGPLVSALIVTGVIDGGAGIRRLLRKMVLWRVSIWWYLFVFFGFPLLELLGTVLVPGNMASFQPMAPLPMLFSYIPFFIYPAMLVGGPLGEEPGWRGFALPRLQVRYGPLLGTLVLSPLWAIWHWPAIWATIWPQNGINFFPNIVLYLLFLTFWAVIMTWLFNNTRGSILIAILAHASVDAFPNAILGPLFPATVVLGAGGAYRGYFGLIVGLGLAALVLIAVTRGRLGYDRYQRDLAAELAGASA